MSEERFDRMEARLDSVASDVEVLKTDVTELKTDVEKLKTGVAANGTAIADLRRHMGVLHEDVISRFQAPSEVDSLRREMRAGFAGLRQILTDHVVVSDAADRRFAATLDDHEHRIQRLENREEDSR